MAVPRLTGRHAGIVAALVLFLVLRSDAALGQTAVSLFDGSSLSGWIVEHTKAGAGAGVLTVRKGAGWVRTDNVFMDFTLRLEVRLERSARAVVYLRAWPTFDARTSAPNNGYRLTVGGDNPAARAEVQPAPWRVLEINCTGHTVRARIDGVSVIEADAVENPQGYIALSAQAGTAEFRNIEVVRAAPPKLQPPDGVYASGPGIEPPRVLRDVNPKYTAEAMRARIQGGIWLSAVVSPNGTASDVRIIQSLDPKFGLDDSAVAALQEWRFAPGTLKGQPVPVLVTVEMRFALK